MSKPTPTLRLHEGIHCNLQTFYIPQLDGLLSDSCSHFDSSNLSSSPSVSDIPSNEISWFSLPELPSQVEGLAIPVGVSHRPSPTPSSHNPRRQRTNVPKNNITVKRDKRFLEALSLPTFSVYNMRSVWSKLSSLAEDMSERATDFSILAEVWEKKENLKQKKKIEEMLEMKGMAYFSTARPGTKRGGGAAIVTRTDRFFISKLNIEIPKPLEVVWGLLRPKTHVGSISKIVLCSFYSPPNSRKKTLLIEHLTTTINKLKIVHPNANFIIAGDKNDLNENTILSICPSFKQLVLKPTRKKKILTIVISDLHRLYQEPRIVPPVPVDQGASGSPSDHQGVLVLPIDAASIPSNKTKKILTIRPIKESSLHSFGKELASVNWNFLETGLSSTELVELFQQHCTNLVEQHFPLKTIKISAHDSPFFNERLRLLRRQRQREYRRSGKSEKYLELKKKFEETFEKAAHDYKDKIISEVKDGKRGSAYKAIRKLGENSSTDVCFSIPTHVEANLSDEQSAELLADYFSKISQEFTPINKNNFFPALRDKLANVDPKTIPILEEYQIYRKVSSAKKPNSTVPGDLPKKVVTTFSVELAEPLEIVFNTITRSGEYPRQWIIEHQTPIPKVHPPKSEDDLRNISCTPFYSKVYESFLSDWLLPIVRPHLDPSNCGGLKGTSISHYLIRLLHFIHAVVDKHEPHAVVMALVDLSKAFNRVDHTLVVEDLHDMKVPGWLLKILVSYLTERSMVLKYQGVTSSQRSLPGSAPQGVFLGCFFFMIKFNGALLRPEVPRPFPKPAPLIISKSTSCTVKYIDDASQARSVNLRKDLEKVDTSSRPRPLEYSEHTGYTIIPVHNNLQKDLNALQEFTDKNLMIINQKKTYIMKFNFHKSLDFPASFNFNGGPMLGVVGDAKVLGIFLSEDLKWSTDVKYMLSRANKKIWTLRKLKILKLDSEILTDYYCKEVRSILEFGVAVWNSGLTRHLSDELERVQKTCVNIILSDIPYNLSYEVSCILLDLEPLIFRRQDLCIRFIQKASKDPQHSDLLLKNTNNFNTRYSGHSYREFKCRNKRFYNSPLCYLTRLLNKYPVEG